MLYICGDGLTRLMESTCKEDGESDDCASKLDR